MGTALHKFTDIKMLTMNSWILAFLLYNVNVNFVNALDDGFCGRNAGDTDGEIPCATANDKCKVTKAATATGAIKFTKATEAEIDALEPAGREIGFQYPDEAVTGGLICFYDCKTSNPDIVQDATSELSTKVCKTIWYNWSQYRSRYTSFNSKYKYKSIWCSKINDKCHFYCCPPCQYVYLSSFKIRFKYDKKRQIALEGK